MEQFGSMALDDMLRQVPGFSTYRRSSSLFANPTSQGVSLRGVGASATSRSSVLLDGIPLNDPFGGWVYWARVPEAAISSVEVANGGGLGLIRWRGARWCHKYSDANGRAGVCDGRIVLSAA